MHVSVLSKIAWRIWGHQAKMLFRATRRVLTHWDYLSWRCFVWAIRSYFLGTSRMNVFYDWFDIVKSWNEENGIIDVGQFHFYYNQQSISALTSESSEILAEYVLSRPLEEYYEVFDSEGPYEIDEVQLQKDDIVVDAGANLGVFSVLAAAKQAQRVYAFEPVKEICVFLKRNISLNCYDEKIVIVPQGLSDKTALQTVYSDGGISTASLLPKDEGTQTVISCTTLDDWIKTNCISRVDFIKADIEGAERYLLAGAQETLRRFKPRLAICTYHLPDDPRVLESLIKKAVPEYKIIQKRKKLYAWC